MRVHNFMITPDTIFHSSTATSGRCNQLNENVDIYPSLGVTMESDIDATNAVINESTCLLGSYKDGRQLFL